MKVSVFNQEGQVAREMDLDPYVFGVSADVTLLHSVVTSIMSNRRRSTAHTKTRAEVSGGGKKPWKQKGTGRARHGSTRSPIWKGGGVTFGPRTERNYERKINAKVMKKAMRMSLSVKAEEGKLLLLDSWNLPKAKTKAVIQVLGALHIPLEKKHAALLVTHEKAHDLIQHARNISSVRTAGKENVSIVDLLKYPYVVTTPETVDYLTSVYGDKRGKKRVRQSADKVSKT
ncbi:MAG: 50S ribosomal protein L4 [bacterium]|nr:50S ribosomal protein L4 [bacterium]